MTESKASRAKAATSKGRKESAEKSPKTSGLSALRESLAAAAEKHGAESATAHDEGAPRAEGLDDAGRNDAKRHRAHARSFAALAALPDEVLSLIEPQAAHVSALGEKEKQYAAQMARHVAGVKSAPKRFAQAAQFIVAQAGDMPALSDAELSGPMNQGTPRQAQAFRKVALALGFATPSAKGAKYDKGHKFLTSLAS